MTNKIRATWAHAAYQELRRRKLNPEPALKRAGLTQLSVVDRESWISFDKEVRFFEAAAEMSGDDCFGLHLPPKIDLRTAGLIAYIGLAAKSLDDSIRNLIHYQHVHNLAMSGELIEDGSRIRLRNKFLEPCLHQNKQREEMDASLILHAARWLTQAEIKLVEVRFIHPRENNREEVERVLGCPVRYEQHEYEAIFDRDDMSLPIPTADTELLHVLTKNADQLLEERTVNGDAFMDLVTERIVDQLSTGRVTAKKIATDLGISQRTISRRLAEHGATFDELIDEIRKDLAMRYLDEGHIKLQELAFLLGFSSHASFSGAFKRWTGKTPSETRRLS